MGWTEFFQRLNGFHRKRALQFTLNLTETHSEVWALCIEVSEAILAEFTGLPQVGRAWFTVTASAMGSSTNFPQEVYHL